ncbi:MAG: MnhB domain-containing protein [Clostridia bacterium]|nr:MnhB domain-containing protein [Clostridia bacterium]
MSEQNELNLNAAASAAVQAAPETEAEKTVAVADAQETIAQAVAEPVAGFIDTNEPSDADNPDPEDIVDVPVARKKALGIIVRYGANLFLPLACTFGGYVVLHGDSSPGGGFQGGVLIAAAVLLVFLGYGSQKLSTTFKESFLHSSETVAEIMYIAIGLIGVIVGLDFAVNMVIDVFEIETAVLMNNAVGYHVMAGVGCLLIMMLGMLSSTEGVAEHEPEDEEEEADEE